MRMSISALELGIDGMKIRRCVFAPKHLNDEAEEDADRWHGAHHNPADAVSPAPSIPRTAIGEYEWGQYECGQGG